MKNLIAGLFLFFVITNIALAGHGQKNRKKTMGEDPFPTACINLSGKWVADNLEFYQIEQNGCDHMVIYRVFDGVRYGQNITPDGKASVIQSNTWTLVERYKWNSNNAATILLADRTFSYADRSVQQKVQMQRQSATLIREVRNQKTRYKDGRVFDRIVEIFLHRVPN